MESEDDFRPSEKLDISFCDNQSLLEVNSPHVTHINYGDPIMPKMYTKDFIGLFAHYAGVGFQGGIQGLAYNFCAYSFVGSSNVCANSISIIFLPWSFKVLYAMVIDSYRPFGLRRKPYMIIGWIGVLLSTLVLCIFGTAISVSGWLSLSMLSMFFLMIADVPADGYCVELGKLEVPGERGQVLATGQRIRFTCSMLAGFIQALLVNGQSTNPSGCKISFLECWGWGLSVSQYYGLLFAILFILFIPILFMKELDAKMIPQRTLRQHFNELWETLKNLTTLYLIIFVTGDGALSMMTNIVTVYLQYYVIGLTNFQSGIDTITTFLAIVGGVWIFQTYFIQRNWRMTQYLSCLLNAVLGLLWILAFYNVGGLLNGWFTIFINLGQNFSMGISQVLFAMAVIEVSKVGQEAITYEFVTSVFNAAITISTIVATQMLSPVSAIACTAGTDDDTATCPGNEVQTDGSSSDFFNSDGPIRFTKYTILVLIVNIVATAVFTSFLPRQKFECAKWKEDGERLGASNKIGYASVFIALAVILYGILATFMLLDPNTSCMQAFGGTGC